MQSFVQNSNEVAMQEQTHLQATSQVSTIYMIQF